MARARTESFVKIRCWLLLGIYGGLVPLLTSDVTLVGAAATASLRRSLHQVGHTGRGLQQAQGAATRQICQNTCNKARNGVCEEGRVGQTAIAAKMLMAYCDLGTDCDDCGPWTTTGLNVTWEDPKVVGPVRLLKSKDLQVRVRPAAVPTDVKFSFAYTDPQKDFDVSYHMEGSGIVEAAITKMVYKVLDKRCVGPGGNRALVVDVGANFGWFSVLAAKMGCRVIAYEPVPVFRAFLEYNIHLNDVANLVTVRSSVVSQITGQTVKIVVPTHGIWGTAGIEGLNIDNSIQSEQQAIQVPSVRLEDEINEDVLLLKVDVEGFEWAVVEGAAKLLLTHDVENIIMEYSPGVPERHFRWNDMLQHPLMLGALLDKYGYRIGNIGDAGKHIIGVWDTPLLPLPEVIKANLKYDIEDIKKWKAGTLACPTPAELQTFEMWAVCGGVPEGLSPRSFRSELTHNTNVWARKAKSVEGSPMRLMGTVGILDPDDPPDKYFQTKGFGMGSRTCESLPAKAQVKHRCRCTYTDCAAEEVAADQAASLGKIPQNYVLP